MILVIAAPGYDVDDGARSLSELSLIAGRQHLELRNRLLIELRRRAAIHRVLVWLAVDHEIVISGPLAEHRCGVVATDVGLAVDDRSGHELHQVEIVAPVDRHILNLARSNRPSGR